MKTEFMVAVSGAQVPDLHWGLNYFPRFACNMKFSHLAKSFRPFPHLAYRMASFPFGLPVALSGLLSDSNSVCKFLFSVNSKGFHLVTIHMQKLPFSEVIML